MDMRTDLNRRATWITGTLVHALGDCYLGTIAEVVQREVRNRWAKGRDTTLENVIVFADRKELVLSLNMQTELTNRFGPESNDWIGEAIAIGCRRVEQKKAGQMVVVWHKVLLPVGEERAAPETIPAWVTDDGPGFSEPSHPNDEDVFEDGSGLEPSLMRRE